jgi:hypothetical protein
MKKKDWKVEIPDSALKDVPEEKREEVKAEIERLFSEGNPTELGKPVERLPKGAKYCPNCGKALYVGPTLTVPDEGVKQIFDCEGCDSSFLGEPLN